MTTWGFFLSALLTHDTAAAKAWSAYTSCHYRVIWAALSPVYYNWSGPL
jgi:hypothetical protein